MKNENKAIIPLRVSICLSALVALSIVCGKYLAINIPPVMRFSFESMPIIFAGIVFGPVAGAIVGVVADLVGCLLVGYGVNPLVTVGAGAIGLVAGAYRFLPERDDRLFYLFKISAVTASAHIVGSVLVKTFGLAIYYDMHVMILMLWRLLNYLIVGGIEGFVLYHLVKNKRLVSEIRKISGGKGK